ncbi:MAG TPA: histidine phosphatase family protein [Rhizomicrobium sp.]|jgi:probable phosphoglycerate mutase
MSALPRPTLYLLRHGECEHNVAGRAASWDDSPLTERGRAQARANGKLLKELAGDLSQFDFFASPIHRTCNTMELVREGAGLPPTGYRADHRLMEIHFGDHTWMTKAEIAALDPTLPGLDDTGDWHYVRPRGESWAGLQERVARFLPTLTRDAVIVTHYGPVRAIRGHHLGLTPEETKRYKPPHAGILRLSQGTEAWFGE